MIKHRFMGRRYDGGASPLGGQVPLYGSLATALRVGRDEDGVNLPGRQWSTRLSNIRRLMTRIGVSVDQFCGMRVEKQNAIVDRLSRMIEREMRRQHPGVLEQKEHERLCRAASVERERVHREILRPWALGELRLERPQGSSLHHLLEYDVRCTPGNLNQRLIEEDDTQIIVVENDWARVVPPSIAGEWRLPFEHCAWEMRVSGVRIITFTEAGDAEDPFMFSVYGANGQWVSDDYRYHLAGDGMRVASMYDDRGVSVEFRRVAILVRNQIRAACVMLDARVCERRTTPVSPALRQRAISEGRVSPRDHEVVRLLREDHRAYRARSIGASGHGDRAPQRGHWRRGTWVHYDDQDSGEEQYANEGGFFVSRTWRRWHFAGDPRNIIEREYRL